MLFISSTLLLLVNAVTLRRERSILFNRVAVLILLYSGIICYDSLNITSLDTGIGIYGGLFHSTSITHSFDLFLCIIGAIVLQLTAYYPRRLQEPMGATGKTKSFFLTNYADSSLEKSKNNMGEQFTITELPLIILFILIGAIFLMSSSDLVSMFLAVELQSYGLYIFATLYRNSELATSAGLTYFLLGGLSSCFILLGSCLLYLNFGITNLDGLYVLSSLSEVNGLEVLVETNQYFNLALLIMSVGYLFKVSAAPFHF
jgi:NADH-ubiquinone oxidoreductase chain 2